MLKRNVFDNREFRWGTVSNKDEFQAFVSGLELMPPFIVKPNWICEDYGHFTDPLVLEWLLEALCAQGEVVVTEAYSARNMLACKKVSSMKLSLQDLDMVRESEGAFLKRTGIGTTLNELDIEYVNVAEEVLAGRIVDPMLVQQAVTSLYGDVDRQEFYGFVPSRLYSLRNGTFINFAKFKVFFSMCTKNIFGMIPEYVGNGSRYLYHGKNDRNLAQNILDINRVYRTFFNIVGLIEGVRSLSCEPGKGIATFSTKFGYDYDVMENCGLVFYGEDPLWLDAFVHLMCGKAPSETEHLRRASDVFKSWPEELESRAIKEDYPLQGC